LTEPGRVAESSLFRMLAVASCASGDWPLEAVAMAMTMTVARVPEWSQQAEGSGGMPKVTRAKRRAARDYDRVWPRRAQLTTARERMVGRSSFML
jgi:hypothetical protein